MMTDKELLQQALDALEMSYELQDIGWVDFEAYKLTCDADILSKLNITIDAIKARLAQPEPVIGTDWPLAPKTGYYNVNGRRVWLEAEEPFPETAPQKKEWVGLTNNEVKSMTHRNIMPWMWKLIGDIEAKLKEKNT